MLLLLKLLSNAGHESILLARKQSPLYKLALQGGWRVHSANLSNVFRYSTAVDVVHAHDARAHTAAALASRRPFVVSRRVAFPVKRGAFSRWKYVKAARFLAVSCFVAEQLKTAGVPCDRIDVVYDAVEQTASRGLYEKTAGIVALQSNDPGKCRHLIAQAASITGTPILYSDNLLRDFEQASMFVYITRAEGLGSAALLAMEMEVPVIASRIDGLAEVFEDEISGLYTSNEPTEIARCIKRFLQFPRFAEQLAAAAKLRVREKFSVHQLLAGTFDSYWKALGG